MRKVCLLTLIMLLSSSFALAQTAAGSGVIGGVIRDPYDEGLPDAMVVVTNQSIGLSRTIYTTIDGVFEISGLPPASGYRLEVSRKGFESLSVDDLEVLVGQTLHVEIGLKEAASSEGENWHNVTLEPLNHASAAIAFSSPPDRLPLRDRRWQDMALLGTAASLDRRNERVVFRAQAVPYPAAMDGLLTSPLAQTALPGVALGVPLAAVKEVQVVSSGYAAGVNNAMGGFLSFATRTGSNGFHGEVYDFFRNGSLSAAERFSGGRKLLGWRHQPGASISGPLRKDHLFYFVNLEGNLGHAQAMNRISSPLLVGSGGLLRDSCNAGTDKCNAAAAFIEKQMDVVLPRAQFAYSGFSRLDYRDERWGDLNLAFGFSRWRWPDGMGAGQVAENGGMLGQGPHALQNSLARFGWTTGLGPFAINELGIGFYRDRFTAKPGETGLATGALRINLAGAWLGSGQPYGRSIWDVERKQYGDHITANIGSHTIKLGAIWTTSPVRINDLNDYAGTYYYSTLTDFALDLAGGARNYALFTQRFGTADRKFTSKEFAVYFQDAWRLLPRLSVTYGARWEKPVLPQSHYSDAAFWRAGRLPSPNIDGSPVLGAVYRLRDDTVVRFGGSFYYAPQPNELVDALLLGSAKEQTPITVNRTYTAAPYFPKVFSSYSVAPAGTKDVVYTINKFRNPLTVLSTVSIEQRLGSRSSVSLNYLSSPGRRLWTLKNVNLTDPTTFRTYTILNSAGNTAGSYTTYLWLARSSTAYGRVYEVANQGLSSYNALVARFDLRLGQDLLVNGSYTFSHAIDNVGGPWAIPNVPLSMEPGKTNLDRGNANFDQRHRLVLAWFWRSNPSGGASNLAQHFLKGWEHSGTFVAASALPATPLVLVNGQQFSGINLLYTTSLNGSGGWARFPLQGPNTLRGEAGYTANVRLARTIRVTDKASAKLIFEVYNLLNSRFATGINTVAYTAAGSVLRPVAGLGAANSAAPARSAQAALRIDF